MKAKEVASKVNQVVVDAKLQETWDAIFERMKAGASDEDLHVSAAALEAAIEANIAPLAANYLGFLLQRLGEEVKDKGMVKTASLRASLLSADQAWRSFHSRLVPLAARAVSPDAFKATVVAKTPRLGDLAWPKSVSKDSPFPPLPGPRFTDARRAHFPSRRK